MRTVGHGRLPGDAFAALLRGAGIRHLVDVRRAPGSRRNPQFARDTLSHRLAEAGIAYTWEPDLGGWRSARPDSRHLALRAFRGYADYMETPTFHAAVARLLARGTGPEVAIMCAESLWWRCHRRMIADALVLLHGVAVEHLFHDGRLAAHTPSREARVEGGRLVYDVGVDLEQVP